MARFNIEASAAVAEWIDLYRADSGGRIYTGPVNRAVSHLPMPTKTARFRSDRFAALADPDTAARLTEAAGTVRVARARAEAQRYASLGCRYYKMKIHHPDPRVNRQRVEAVRRSLGDGVRLMVDVNQRLDVLGAIRQAALLEDFDLLWFEEPVLADDVAACAEVARAIRIPVATGENHQTRFEFRELIERGAARGDLLRRHVQRRTDELAGHGHTGLLQHSRQAEIVDAQSSVAG